MLTFIISALSEPSMSTISRFVQAPTVGRIKDIVRVRFLIRLCGLGLG